MAHRWHGGRLLNIGCAHGPDFLPFKDDFELWGLDFSPQMTRLARKYADKFDLEVNLMVADAISLPYLDDVFDCAIAVATYHHIQGDIKRLEAFRELRRVLKPKAEAFITVWNRWQPRFWLRGRETYMAWKTGRKTFYRYYYLFSYSELVGLLTKAGFNVLGVFPERSYRFPLNIFSRNICALIKAD